MITNRVFKLCKSGVASEHFDNEVILLNLPKGNYYSIRGTGFELWNHILNGASEENMVRFLACKYGADARFVEKDAVAFFNQLIEEGLIFADSAPNPLPFVEPEKAHIPYAKPELEVYSDMQDILMLDPIHDVDSEQGWPIKK